MLKFIVSVLSWTLGMIACLICLPLNILFLMIVSQEKGNAACGFFMRVIVRSFLVRVRLEGREAVDLNRTHLFMSNHASFFDMMILAGWLPGRRSGIEAAEHFSWPVWGAWLRRSGMIPIDRSNARASLRSLKLAAERLKNGWSVLILPEGTRSKDGKMLPFRKLPFKLAKMGETDIVPVGLEGTFQIKAKTSWMLKPGVVHMRFGEVIPEEEVREAEMEALMEKTRERIAALVNDG
jgi:1-acyl-sn-glycerol-3-phosphate acyltransferase